MYTRSLIVQVLQETTRRVVAVAGKSGRRRRRSARRPIHRGPSRRSPTPFHHPPDVRHGPADCTTVHRACRARRRRHMPGVRRSTVTHATGGRMALPPEGEPIPMCAADRCDPHARRVVARRSSASRTRPADDVSTRTGVPQRVSPTSADSRAVSVESASADGSARSSSENCVMRAGAGSTSIATMSMAAGGRMRFEIEQHQRAQHPRVAHRRPAAAARGRASSDRRAADPGAAPPRPDRRARAPSRADRAAAPGRTTTARALDRPLELQPARESAAWPRRARAAADRCPRASCCSACTAPARDARPDRLPATPPAHPASQSPTARDV